MPGRSIHCLVSVAAYHDNRTHVIGFGPQRNAAFLAWTEKGLFHQHAGHCSAWTCVQDCFYLIIGQVIVDAICAEKYAIARLDRDLVNMHRRRQRSAKCLGNAPTESKVTKLHI